MQDKQISRRNALVNTLLVGGGLLGVAAASNAQTTQPPSVATGTLATFGTLSATPAAIGQIVTTRCHTNGTVGGGQFIGVSSSGLVVDNGVISASTTNGVHWKRTAFTSLSPYDFGAGDINKDDADAIQGAIDYFYTNGGGTINIAGIFNIKKTINLKPYVKLIGNTSSFNSIQAPGVTTVINIYKPLGYVPPLVLGCAITNLTINGGTIAGNTGINASNVKGMIIEGVEFGNLSIGLAWNQTSSSDQSYFNKINQCMFASCSTGITFGGAANRNTFDTNTYNSCTRAYDFGAAGNISETNVFINENVEGCRCFAEWNLVVYGQTWIGLTIENPVSNGFVCTVKDPGRQVFINLALIPSNTPMAVDFYKINTNFSTLLGSISSSSSYSYGFRIAEELQLSKSLRNKAYYGTVSFTTSELMAGKSTTTSVTITGALVGDFVKISADKDLLGCVLTAYVSATNTVAIRVQNASSGNVALTNVAFTAVIEKLG